MVLSSLSYFGFAISCYPTTAKRRVYHSVDNTLHFHVYTLADFCGHKDASDYGQKDTSTNESNQNGCSFSVQARRRLSRSSLRVEDSAGFVITGHHWHVIQNSL
jgi:hypothetical protein